MEILAEIDQVVRAEILAECRVPLVEHVQARKYVASFLQLALSDPLSVVVEFVEELRIS